MTQKKTDEPAIKEYVVIKGPVSVGSKLKDTGAIVSLTDVEAELPQNKGRLTPKTSPEAKAIIELQQAQVKEGGA
jgi:hypothetical protein